MIAIAMMLSLQSGSQQVAAVEDRYKAALETITSCQKVKSYQVVNAMKPIADPGNSQTIEQVAGQIRQGCEAEKSAFLEAVDAKVALNNPSDQKRQKQILSGVRASVGTMMDKMARGWGVTALKNNGVPPPEPTKPSTR